MQAEPTIGPGVQRAALAFSALDDGRAGEITRHLSVREQSTLRIGLRHVRDATEDQRLAALRQLVVATRRGPTWTVPESHEPATCPFRCVEFSARDLVVRVLENVALQRPLYVAVALSHIAQENRDAIWTRLEVRTRGDVTVALREVPSVSVSRTRAFARVIQRQLDNAVT